MDHSERGRLIIINNKHFLPQKEIQLEERIGTEVDAANLKDDFTQLGFSVQVENDQTADEMLQLMISGNVSAVRMQLLSSDHYPGS